MEMEPRGFKQISRVSIANNNTGQNGRKKKEGLYRYKGDSGNGCQAEAVEF
jgi:hypothetical protein